MDERADGGRPQAGATGTDSLEMERRRAEMHRRIRAARIPAPPPDEPVQAEVVAP